MKSFTLGTPEMVTAMNEALPNEAYPMTLRPTDMRALITYLSVAVGYVDPQEIPDHIREDAERLFSDIASTLDIEGV